jgi:heat shock protein HtpX
MKTQTRSPEYEADKGGAQIAENPLYLALALTGLHLASQRIPLEANPATSHMVIVNAFSAGGNIKLFSTHPPIDQRIAGLEVMTLTR